MIDLLYVAFNRLEFTRKSFETMLVNTDWSQVSRLIIYDDGSTDGTFDYLLESMDMVPVHRVLHATSGLGPVGIMREFLAGEVADVFAKIDNDTMLPPAWLKQCLDLMEQAPEVDVLGIECRLERESGPPPRKLYDAEFIGGIGLMRRRAFSTLPEPASPGSRFGFTEWQCRNPQVKKAWIDPALPVCLLNMVPLEPWASLSREYIAKSWQRPWPVYNESNKALWEWWA